MFYNVFKNSYTKPFFFGVIAFLALLIFYFILLTLVSGWAFAKNQFASFWYFIVSLAFGFAFQVSLYTYLKNFSYGKQDTSSKVLGATGVTSSITMISCCAHYFVNLFPILGTVAIITFIAQYQVQLFWIGFIFNLGGIFYMINKINKFKQI